MGVGFTSPSGKGSIDATLMCIWLSLMEIVDPRQLVRWFLSIEGRTFTAAAKCALVRSVVDRTSGQNARGLKGWFVTGIGMRLHSSGDLIVKKYGWALLLAVNLVMAIVMAMVYARAGPVSVSPGPSIYPVTQSTTASPAPAKTDLPLGKIYNLNPIVNVDHWVSWALIDIKSGAMAGSDNWAEPGYVMSMIKPWIVADYLNQHSRPDSWTLSRMSSMIVDSNDQAAYEYFAGKASLNRLVVTCGLTDLIGRGWSWSLTAMSARDAARMGYCIYNGHATSAKWTSWIVNKMRHVRGEGDFGPRSLFPDRTQLATKNGWYNWDGYWYVNCLTMNSSWIISTLQRWSNDGGSTKRNISKAESVCNSVASQVLKLS